MMLQRCFRLLFSHIFVVCLLGLACLLSPQDSFAWGKRGRPVLIQTALQLLSKNQPKNYFLRRYSYDIGYYGNVPEIVWKKDPKSSKIEESEQWINLEIYDRLVKDDKWSSERQKFFKKYKNIPRQDGRLLWRIAEVDQELGRITDRIHAIDHKRKNTKKKNVEESAFAEDDKSSVSQLSSEDRKLRLQLQEKWLMMAGILGFYVAHAAQPLHVSENFDGQLTGQSSLHGFFEVDMVGQLYPDLESSAMFSADQNWAQFREANRDVNTFELGLKLARESFAKLDTVLRIDRLNSRSDFEKSALAFKYVIVERMGRGAMYLAAILEKHLGWDFDGVRPMEFFTKPAYVMPLKDFK